VPKFCSIIGATLILSVSSATPARQQEIAELYRRGVSGDKAAVEQCIEKLEAVLKDQPNNQLARVYLGSAYTLRSRDLGFGPKKLEALKRGLATMDEAVAAAPDEPKVRLARALTTSSLPAFFGRRSSSRKDFELLAETAQRAPAKFEAGDLQIVYYNAGLAAKAAGDRARAVALWREAQRHPENPSLVPKIEDALK